MKKNNDSEKHEHDEQRAEHFEAAENRLNIDKLSERETNFREIETRLEEVKKSLDEKEKILEERAKELSDREAIIRTSEIQRDNGYVELRRDLDEELQDIRKKFNEYISNKRSEDFAALNEEIIKEKTKRLSALSSELDADRERVQNEIAVLKKEFEQEKTEIKKELAKERDTIKTDRINLENETAKVEQEKTELQYSKKILQAKEDALFNLKERINEEVEAGIAEAKKSFEMKEKRTQEECERLRKSISQIQNLNGIYDELKRKLGGQEPEKILLELTAKTEEIKKLHEELLSRPTEEMRKKYKTFEAEIEKYKQSADEKSRELDDIRKVLSGEKELKFKVNDLERENKSLKSQNESIERECARLQGELTRLQSSYERAQERDSRIKDIEIPLSDEIRPRMNDDDISEIDWLDNIGKSCIQYGLKFPERILHAFHTALKTAEWSPLTVLAGVSGTGKSELPRLYSHFGGFTFMSLAVQPNWDSQEAMLGFFNSIDNKFDAQPVLRLLAQAQKPLDNKNNYPGLKDTMCIILLDEMNLAHVELYFAEFLSKLELRRGSEKNKLPKLLVKLGSGIEPYQLELGRNVLWTGTMNQDETTKSLSDKVLDRSIVINFPRPTELERRKKLKPLDQIVPLITTKKWGKWVVKEVNFKNDQILPYKKFIEEMNTYLSVAGRAIGHRVWQSMEYYMSNHPRVIAALDAGDDNELQKAMKLAFEDQLVQKVMPKLRGIETRGKSKKECLEKISNQLKDYTIVKDFEFACEFGYGQFIWNSAMYLEEKVEAGDNGDKNNETSDN